MLENSNSPLSCALDGRCCRLVLGSETRRMNQPVPDWVSFDAVKTTGLDLLGLRAPVQQISNELFNGVTTITPKLRYLSVISWVLWRYSQARLPDKKSSFMEFAAAQEA